MLGISALAGHAACWSGCVSPHLCSSSTALLSAQHHCSLFNFTAAGVDQPLALSPLTTIIATASRPAVSTSSLPAVPAPEPAPTNRKLLQGGAARAPAPQPVASGANKLNPDFAIAEDSGNASSSMVSTGGRGRSPGLESFFLRWHQ